jgi:four helix bundle protein
VARDYRKLEVFRLADSLALEIYRRTHRFPPEERYGLRSQIRRAATSVPTNLVEGCLRTTEKEYLYFVSNALSSAGEAHYLVGFCHRAQLLGDDDLSALDDPYDKLCRSLSNLITQVRRR